VTATPDPTNPTEKEQQHPMDMDTYLKTVGDYADQLAAADRQANKDTMGVAEAMDAMYESREWVSEWLAEKPRPKNGGSNRWQADSRNRFAQWQAWKLEQAGRRSLNGSYAYRLLDGVRIAKAIPNFARGEIRTEKNLRPLKWLLTNRYEDRIPEVWATAVDLAGSADKVTEKHTREALNQWKKAKLAGPRGGKSYGALTAAAKANRLRRNMLDEMAAMYQLACRDERARDEFHALLSDLDQFLDDHSSTDKTAA
jgi:hypothetical protein